MADSDNFKENIAYGTSLCELIQTEDNEAYTKTNHEQIQYVANQAYGTTDHERIQTKCNKVCEGMLVTTRNEVYVSVDNAKRCQLRQNQAYVPTNTERIHFVLPAARISEDKYYYDTQEHYYEQIIISDHSAPGPAQKLQLGNQTEENDAIYDYIK